MATKAFIVVPAFSGWRIVVHRAALTIVLGITLNSTVAQAVDAGELATQLMVDGGFGKMRNPVATYGPGAEDSDSFNMQVSELLDYAVSDSWSIATGLRVSLPATTTAYGVAYRERGPGNLLSSTWQASLPLRITLQHTTGNGILWLAQLEGGMTWARWQVNSMSRDAGGGAREAVYVDPLNFWSKAAYARVGAACQWRDWDHFAMALGPFYQAGLGQGWQVGLALQVEYMTGVGWS